MHAVHAGPCTRSCWSLTAGPRCPPSTWCGWRLGATVTAEDYRRVSARGLSRRVPRPGWVSAHGFRAPLDEVSDYVRGDGMSSVGYRAGDIIAIKRTPDAAEGDVVMARIGTEITLKCFHRPADDRVELEPVQQQPREPADRWRPSSRDVAHPRPDSGDPAAAHVARGVGASRRVEGVSVRCGPWALRGWIIQARGAPAVGTTARGAATRRPAHPSGRAARLAVVARRRVPAVASVGPRRCLRGAVAARAAFADCSSCRRRYRGRLARLRWLRVRPSAPR